MPILAILVLLAPPLAAFEPPGKDARLGAIGSTKGLPETLRRALDPEGDFEPIRAPRPGDWLAEHRERGQTFDAFRRATRNVPTERRREIHLLPLGDFSAERSPSLDSLERFAEAFFSMEVTVLPPHPVGKDDFSPRESAVTGRRQLLTGDILSFLGGRMRPEAFSLVAVTMEDLYPDPSWNFVFGQATIRKGTGVFSFARYDPLFGGGAASEKGDEAARRRTILRRSLHVLAHETCHIFGLLHCTFFECLMNGSNHLAESDSRPLHLCPVCLRKLHSSIGFEPVRRWEALREFYRAAGLVDEAAWVDRRVRRVTEGLAPPAAGG